MSPDPGIMDFLDHLLDQEQRASDPCPADDNTQPIDPLARLQRIERAARQALALAQANHAADAYDVLAEALETNLITIEEE